MQNSEIYAANETFLATIFTPLDTWSCPTLGSAYVLILKPIPPEFVLFPVFWVSNIPQYFYFAALCVVEIL